MLDKETTGAGRLPSDGRGVTIAVLDTGVDPAAPGMQATSHGEGKIIDVIDATGAGDVDTSTRVQTDADGWLVNEATGRRLRVDATKWGFRENPKEWRVGAKSAELLWPKAVRDRLVEENKRRIDVKHAAWLAKARKEATEHAGSSQSAAENDSKKELEARLAGLERARKDLEPSRSSVAPLLDVLVWEDDEGVARCVVVDGSTQPDLTERDDLVPLADFARERQFATFGDSLLTYSVSFYGDTTTIVTPCGDHGTHCASIAAAYDARDPDKCGVAPGARIVSIKIGDARVDGMETGAALARAAAAAQKHNVDLINLSYGEPGGLCDAGAFVRKAKRLVDEDPGLLFVSSAGNSGPALSTAGSPGASTSATLGVGAMVTPQMRGDLYGQRASPAPPMLYTFSSRGPATDGDWGVAVCAPGGSVASIPRYTLQPHRLMHGTSMSSPNAVGSIACLLGALKAQGVPYAPAAVRRAVEATAKPIAGCAPYGAHAADQGKGVLAVDAAFEALRAAVKEADVAYDVRVVDGTPPGAPHARGVYLREPHETEAPREKTFAVTPRFFRDSSRPADDKARFKRNVELRATADWVEAGSRMVLTYATKQAIIKIDPTKLPEDSLSHAEVLGYDADDPNENKVPLFRVPVTVIKPKIVSGPVATICCADETFAPGAVSRHFVVAPEWATSATLVAKCRSSRRSTASASSKRLIHLASQQLVQQTNFKSYNSHKRTWMNGDDKCVTEVGYVCPGRTIEVCVAQDWSSLEPVGLEVEVHFKADGVVGTGTEELVLRGARGGYHVWLKNPGPEPLVASPQIKMYRWVRPARPIEATVRPCAHARDEFRHFAHLEPKRAYELELKYEWTHSGPNGGAQFRLSGHDLVYDSPFEGMFARIYEKSSGRTLGYCDARTGNDIKGFEHGCDYAATLVVRSESPETLDRIKDTEVWIDWGLKTELAAKCYATVQALHAGGPSDMKDVQLRPGESRTVFVAPPNEADLPKDVRVGDVLAGRVTYAKSPSLFEGTTRRVSHPVLYFVPPATPKPANDKKKNHDVGSDCVGLLVDSVPDESAARKLAAATFARQLKFLADEKDLDDASAASLAESLVKHNPAAELEIRRAALKRAANATDSNGSSHPLAPKDAEKVLLAAARLRTALNQTAVALHVATRRTDVLDEDDGKKNDDGRDKDDAAHKALLESLRWTAEARLASALDARDQSSPSSEAEETLNHLKAAIADLDKWVDTKKAEKAGDACLRAAYEKLRGKPGLALQAIDAWLDSAKKKKAADLQRARRLRADLYDDLGWPDWAAAERKRLLKEFPPAKLSN